ncbi:MAG: nucleotidyltransferase domain-containing protein [Candidatus Micrarchaeota archaeon]
MKVLSLFLERVPSKFYVKQLARELKIGPASASRSLKNLHKQGFLLKTKEGRENYYSLIKEKQLNKYFAVTYTLFWLEQFGLTGKLLEIDPHIVSVALFGSIAAGDYDENSDLDLLIISKKEKADFYPVIRELEKEFKREVLPTIINPIEWIKMTKKNDRFCSEVEKRYIMLYGNRLET